MASTFEILQHAVQQFLGKEACLETVHSGEPPPAPPPSAQALKAAAQIRKTLARSGPPANPEKDPSRFKTGNICLAHICEKLSAVTEPLQLQWSLSHSSGLFVAVGRRTGEGDEIEGIGIDVEPADRQMRAGVIERITEEGERELGLSPLQFWTAKEACFKANPQNQDTFVGDYIITSWDPDRQAGMARIGERNIEFMVRRLEKWVLALAKILRTS